VSIVGRISNKHNIVALVCVGSDFFQVPIGVCLEKKGFVLVSNKVPYSKMVFLNFNFGFALNNFQM